MKRLREEFIKNDLLVWFSYLEKLFDQNSKKFSSMINLVWQI